MVNLLVVDDDPTCLKTVSEFLKRSGYTVRTCRNGQEALRAVTEQKPDLMVLDVLMPPGINGYEVAHYIKFHSQFDEKLPIILLTAEERAMDDNLSILLGIEYMHKSSPLKHLVDRIEKILQKKDEDTKVIEKERQNLQFKGFFERDDKSVSEEVKEIIKFRIEKFI